MSTIPVSFSFLDFANLLASLSFLVVLPLFLAGVAYASCAGVGTVASMVSLVYGFTHAFR